MTTKQKRVRFGRIGIALGLAALVLTAWLTGIGGIRPAAGEEMRPHPAQDATAPSVGINGNPCTYATIGDAIAAASGGDTIYIPSGNVYNEQLGTVGKDLTFVAAVSDCSAPDAGATPDQTRINGSGNSGGTYGGIVDIGLSTTLTFSRLTLENASASYGGIAYVSNDGRLILDRSIVRLGTASSFGGGVRVYTGAALELRNGSLIYDNEVTVATGGGGGVAVYQGAMTMTQDSAVGQTSAGNTSAGDAGGILLHSSTLHMDDSFIAANTAAAEGGGIMAFGSSVAELYGYATIGGATSADSNTALSGGGVYVAGPTAGIVLSNTSQIQGNAASDDGGGVYAAADAYVAVEEDASINNNTADSSGGGVYLTGEDTRLNMIYGGGEIRGNDAHGASSGDGGGGVYLEGGASVYADSADIISNTSTVWGGGILIAEDAVPTQTSVILINDSLLGSNSGSHGGGIYIQDGDGSIIFTGSRVERNEAAITGGGIRLFGDSSLNVTSGSVISNNTAGHYGGGLGMYTGTVILDDATVAYNEATNEDGGGLLVARGALTATDTAIDFNIAGGDGGGIFHTSGLLHLGTVDGDGSLSVNRATRGGGLYDMSGEQVIISPTVMTSFDYNSNYASDSGGGAYITNTTNLNLIGDLTISSNDAENDGGAFYVHTSLLVMDNGDASSVRLGAGNDARNGSGGAIYAEGALVGLDNVEVGFSGGFGNSAAVDGGGIYADGSYVVLEDTRTFYNSAGNFGGGVAAVNGSYLLVRTSYGLADVECDPLALASGIYCSEIRENEASNSGAGIYLKESDATILNTAFLDNVGLSSGTAPGAALWIGRDAATVMTNTLISGHGTYSNTAVHVYSGGSLASYNSTYAGNQDTPIYVVGTAAVTLTNNIIWGNTSSAYYQPGVIPNTSCNDTQSALSGPGDISADPHFVTTTRGPYRLGPSSPAVDACSAGATYDLDGRMRPIDGDGDGSADHDMGAFEQPFYLHTFIPLVAKKW